MRPPPIKWYDWNQAALETFPAFRQRVHTFIRLRRPLTIARTGWIFGLKRRRVLLFAWLTRFPNCGPLPHISHRLDMIKLPPELDLI